jgi:hypothetical protein
VQANAVKSIQRDSLRFDGVWKIRLGVNTADDEKFIGGFLPTMRGSRGIHEIIATTLNFPTFSDSLIRNESSKILRRPNQELVSGVPNGITKLSQ